LLNKKKEILVKSYQLSKGNPIEDTQDVVSKVREQVELQGATLEVLGIGTTGYAKDILKDVVGADAAIVETVAHTESALHFYDDVDVICDVGGQDIKIMIMKDGRVKDFKLNTQCSAGNGYFLQSTASDFNVDVVDYADTAFSAKSMPNFGYGCAVFMQSDIVDFQRQGWKPAEIMAGLANVLPKNIWLYVSQIPNLTKLGSKFVLQGGTQHNLAAVKAQVDFIEKRFKDKGEVPDVIVHEHCGESGAIGAAIEAVRLYNNGRKTTFIGLDEVDLVQYKTITNEDTRCYFCKNKCLRTFIDITIDKKSGEPLSVASESGDDELEYKSKVPLEKGAKRLIVGNSCERGLVEDVEAMKIIKKQMDATLAASANLVEESAKEIFRFSNPEIVSDQIPKLKFKKKVKDRIKLMENRENIRIGIPKLLNMYSMNPLFTGYFQSLGVQAKNIVYSDFTSEKLYKEGAKRGAIDPCFPSKLGIPHVHNLIYNKHSKKPLDIIFFPMIDDLPTDLVETQSCRACPTVTTTPEAVKAAFTKEGDIFKAKGIRFMNTFVNTSYAPLFAKQMYEEFKDIFGLSKEENLRAVNAGYEALFAYKKNMRTRAREILDKLEAENKVGIVMLGRPYHNDPGINHEILVEFQKLGYPIFTQESLPLDEDLLQRLFADDIEEGRITHPMDINDVWKNSYSENTSIKVWAAKFIARHPNLVALELSNFKCGHDAPIYTVVEETVENSGTPYFNFKDLDENKPTGSIKIRVETIHYFLTRFVEDMARGVEKKEKINITLESYERDLRQMLAKGQIDIPDDMEAAMEMEIPIDSNVRQAV